MWRFQPPDDGASREEWDAWSTRELQDVLYELELREMGVLHACHGLVWKVPLCNDSSHEY